MWPLFIYPDHYKKSFTFYFIYYKKGKMLGLPTKKKRKAKYNSNDLIFRKKFSLPYGTLLSLSSHVNIERSSAEYNSAKSLANKYKLFVTKSKQTVNFSNITKIPFWKYSSAPSKKYIMIEEFKGELKSFKNIFNKTKKLELLRE